MTHSMIATPSTQTCPCCGAVIPTPNQFNLTPTELRVYNFIAKHPGYTLEAITAGIYAGTYNGGPAYNIISVYICKINKKLRGQRIVNPRGFGATYRLVKDTSE
jgi:DNA-binding response OmpR family regulator